MSDVREMLRESVTRMFSEKVDRQLRHDAEDGSLPVDLWRLVEQSGFTRVLVPENAGGTGGGWPDAYPLIHAVGYHQAPVPLAETAIGNHLLSMAQLALGDGPLALVEQDETTLRLDLRDGRLVIDGTAKSVPWARTVNQIVLSGSVKGRQVIARVRRNQPNVAVTKGENMAKEPRDAISFTECAAEEFAYSGESATSHPVVTFGALARAIAMVGAAESALAQSIQYAKDRTQFGRAIAKFQAVQHMLAVLACEVGAAKTAVEGACTAAAPHFRIQTAVAKIRAGYAAGAAARIAHQIHGAIGMTQEHGLHFATRRLWSWRSEYGNEATWAQEIGADAIRRGGQRFWSDLTLRTAAPE